MKSMVGKFTAVLAIAAMVLALAPSYGFANGNGNDNGTNTNTNTATGGAASTGAITNNANSSSAGGAATNNVGNVSGIGNRSFSPEATANSTNVNANKNEQGQIQGQKQKQGQVQGQQIKDSANNSNSVSVDNGDVPRQAPPAFAPGLVAAPETCMGAVAVGASSPFGGISFGTTYKSEDCELRMYARSLMAMGSTYYPAAVALLAQNPNVQKALRAAGLPIPGDAVAAALVAPVANAEQLQAVAAVVSTPSREESKVLCSSSQRKVRAGNGEWFCQ